MDAMGRIVMANPGAREILAKSATSLVGKLLSALVASSERLVVQDLVAELLQSNERMQSVVSFHIDNVRVTARLAPVLENLRCTGLLVIIEKAA